MITIEMPDVPSIPLLYLDAQEQDFALCDAIDFGDGHKSRVAWAALVTQVITDDCRREEDRVEVRRAWLAVCPFCTKTHLHDAGGPLDDPLDYGYLLERPAPCAHYHTPIERTHYTIVPLPGTGDVCSTCTK